MKKYLLIFLFVPYVVFAQQPAQWDILKAELKKEITDSARYVLLLRICGQYVNNNPDSAIFYAQESVRFAAKNKEKLPAWTLWNCSDALGKALWSAGNFPDAQEYFFKQIKQSEAISDTLGLLRAYVNLGGLNIEEDNYKEAIYYLRKALPFYHGQKGVTKWFFAFMFDYLSRAYERTDKLDSALHFAQMSLQYSIMNYGESANYQSAILFGMIYSRMGQPSLALEYFRSYLTGVKNNPAQVKGIIDCYYEMSNHFERNQQTDSAIHYARKSFILS